MTDAQRIRELTKHLRDLAQTVARYLSLLDEAMQRPDGAKT